MTLNRLFILAATVFVSIAPLQMQAASVAEHSTITTSVESASPVSTPVDGTVNLNNADVTGLENLKGIGAGKAQAIIDYRNQHGSFKSVDDLTQVKGFSKKTVDNLLKKNPNKIVAE